MKCSILCSTALVGLVAWNAQGQNPPASPDKPAPQQPPAQQQPPTQQQRQQPVQQQPPAQQPAQQQQQPPAQQQQQQPAQPQQQVGQTGAQVQTTGTMVNGRIVRTGQDSFVVQGADNKSYTFYTNQQSRFWMNNNPYQYSNLQAGANVSAWYVPQGERYYVNRVNVLAAGAAFPVQEAVPAPAPAVQPAPTETQYQGDLVRVIGQDQVVIRTSDGKEIIIYVTPQTTYKYDNRAATITDLRPGTPVRVDYDLRDRRPIARGILGLRRN